MNRGKSEPPKKILVRNASRPLPKVSVTSFTSTKSSGVPKKTASEPAVRPRVGFHEPEPNTILQISKKIDEVVSLKVPKSKSASSLAVDEKMTRKLNFPADRPVYRNLIPIQPVKKQAPVLKPRDPLPKKDLEPPPLLSFAKHSAPKEYVYIPKAPPKTDKKPARPGIDHLNLYRILQMHDENNVK